MGDSFFDKDIILGYNGTSNQTGTNSDRFSQGGKSIPKVAASSKPFLQDNRLTNAIDMLLQNERNRDRTSNKIYSANRFKYDSLIKEYSNGQLNAQQVLAKDKEWEPAGAFTISEDEMRQIFNSSNFYSPEQIHNMRFSRFARYGMYDIANEHSGSREYLFFTKPDLHIFKTGQDHYELNPQLSNVTFFQNAIKQYPLSLLMLQQTLPSNHDNNANHIPGFESNSLYIPLLSNHVTSSLDLPGISATETENNTSLYQVKTTYRDSSEQSDFGFDFSLEFWDTRYIDVYMFFKAYDEYCRQEFYRNVTPPKLSYITDKVNCKQFSIYKIIVDETNTIIFYAKATGVYPLGVPRDAMSNFEGTIKMTVPMKAQFVSDMDPIILTELNNLTKRSMGISKDSDITIDRILPLYDKNNNTANTTWGMYPFIMKKSKRRGSFTDKEDKLYTLHWISP